jgi:hypothetical protein
MEVIESVEFVQLLALPKEYNSVDNLSSFCDKRTKELQNKCQYPCKPIYLSTQNNYCLMHYKLIELINNYNEKNINTSGFKPINVDRHTNIAYCTYNDHIKNSNYKTEQTCVFNTAIVLKCNNELIVAEEYIHEHGGNYCVLYGTSINLLYSLSSHWQTRPANEVQVFKFVDSGYNSPRYELSDEKFNSQVSLNGNYINEYISLVTKDMNNFKTMLQQFTILGCTQGLNYLLYGPPGTGKTSFIKKFVQDNNFNIYITNLSRVRPNFITHALSPKVNNKRVRNNTCHDNDNCSWGNSDNEQSQLMPLESTKFRVILIEDFDRYIEGSKDKNGVTLSDILNTLDGFDSDLFTIRIFTANIVEKIQDAALLSRFKRILYFGNPTVEVITEHLNKVFNQELASFGYVVTNEEITELANLSVNNQLSMRNLNKLLVRYVDTKDPVKQSINNFDAFIKEIELFREEEQKKKTENDSDDGTSQNNYNNYSDDCDSE